MINESDSKEQIISSDEAEQEDKDEDIPKDKHKLVYIVCCWLGIGSLLPWNFYYNADGYWKFKFRDVNDYRKLNTSIDELTPMQVFWGSNLSIVSMAPNFLFLLLNVLVGHKMRINPRIYGSLLFNIVLFIASLAFTQVNTDQWQTEFYYTTLIFALIFNMNDSIFQGAFTALLGRFPSKYMSALAQGQAIGGTLASGISVFFLVIGGSAVNVALFSFIFAAIFLASAFVVFIYVRRQPFYLHFAPDEQNIKANSDDNKVDYLKILSNTWPYLTSVFLIYVVTLSVFPAIPILTVSMFPDSSWSKYFIPVGCFFIYNLMDLVGRTLAGFIRWPGPTKLGGFIILLLSIIRIVFIPLYMFCNARPDDRVHSSVLFPSDAAFVSINVFFGLSNGYLTNIIFMNTPKMMKEAEDQSVAASLMVFLLVGGLFVGSGLTRLFVQLL